MRVLLEENDQTMISVTLIVKFHKQEEPKPENARGLKGTPKG